MPPHYLHLFLFIYLFFFSSSSSFCRMTVKCCQPPPARWSWIFFFFFFPPTTPFWFFIVQREIWAVGHEVWAACVVRIPSNLHVCFLNRACSLISPPPPFSSSSSSSSSSFPFLFFSSANRQEMQPGRSAIKQTLALKGVRGFVPARFAC